MLKVHLCGLLYRHVPVYLYGAFASMWPLYAFTGGSPWGIWDWSALAVGFREFKPPEFVNK